jgi:peptidyl-prolyl cis-trans isomerase SurA
MKKVFLSVGLCVACVLSGSGVFAQVAKRLTLDDVARPTVAPAPAPAVVGVRLVNEILAVVNNEVISRSELMEKVNAVKARAVKQNIALPPEGQIVKQILEQLILERIQLQMAKEQGIFVDDAMLERGINRLAQQNRISVPDMFSQLEKDGILIARFKEDVRVEITLQRLREREVDNRVTVAESEVDYALGLDKSGVIQEEINLAHILIKVPENASSKQVENLYQRAEEVLQKAKSGVDFAVLSSNYSEASQASTGGDLGWRTKDRLPKIFVEAVTSLGAGQISSIVRSVNGFHIIKLLGKRAAQDKYVNLPSVDQVRARHILIKVDQANSKADAVRKLVDIKQRIENKAATFEELAKVFSQDLSASSGGDLGWIYPGDTVPEFERAMNGLAIGQVSDPIETPFGYHLIKVLERKVAEVSPERQRMVVKQMLREQKAQEAMQEWLKTIRDSAYVEYRVNF